MFRQLLRKIRRTARHWTTDPTRADRNAVIQRIVTAAAKESKDNLSDSGVRKTPLPTAAALLGKDTPPPLDEPLPVEVVGQRAHEIWLRNGRPQGTAAKDWQQAEAEIRAERRAKS